MNYYIQLILLSPLWYLSRGPARKSWSDFKSGLRPHVCSFNYDPTERSPGMYWHCSHPGCNITKIREEDGCCHDFIRH